MSCQIILKKLNESEAALLYLLIGKCVDNGTKEISLVISDYTSNSDMTKEQWTKVCMDMMNNLLTVKGYEELGGGGRQYFCFFEKYRYVPETKQLIYTLSENGFYYAEDIRRTYTSKEFIKLTQLKSKYSSRIYQLLAFYKIAGYHNIPTNELYSLLEIPNSYSSKELSRKILKPALAQIMELGLLEKATYRYFRPFRETAEGVIFEWAIDTPPKECKIDSKPESSPKYTKLMDDNYNSFYEY